MASLKDKYGMIGLNDFPFVKVAQKKISILHLSKEAEYSYEIVKKFVGQGLLYIRMKKHFQFFIDEHVSEDSESDPPQVLSTSGSTSAPTAVLFQTSVIFKLQGVNASFSRELKENLLKILRMKSTARKH